MQKLERISNMGKQKLYSLVHNETWFRQHVFVHIYAHLRFNGESDFL